MPVTSFCYYNDMLKKQRSIQKFATSKVSRKSKIYKNKNQESMVFEVCKIQNMYIKICEIKGLEGEFSRDL